MTSPDDSRQPDAPRDAPRPGVLRWLPWEKLTVWSLFILAVYALRHFFFVFFMTFIIAYTMRGVVVRLTRLLWPRGEGIWLQRILALFCFAALLGALYGIGQYFGPELQRQGEGLVRKVATQIERPQEKFDEVLRDTVGRWLFSRQYGDVEDDRYRRAFEKYQAQGIRYSEYKEFARVVGDLEANVEAELATEQSEAELQAIRDAGKDEEMLREWVTQHIVEGRLKSSRVALESEWERNYRQSENLNPGLPKLEKLTPVEREKFLRYYVAGKILGEGTSTRESLEDEWKEFLGREAVQRFKAEKPEAYGLALREYFEALVLDDPRDLLAGFRQHPFLLVAANFERLRVAYAQDENARVFSQVWDEFLPQVEKEEQEARLRKDRQGFELRERELLVHEWKKTDLARRLGEKLQEWVAGGLTWGVNLTRETLPKVLVLLGQFALSLLLAFLITYDVPRLKRGILKLRDSRVRNFYDEISPGLVSFGRLIGRAFQAQGVIALCNTLLTFVAIKLLGIGPESEIFLCSIVFLCSFIPVLGVVLSSVPIAIIAIIQDGGGVVLALWAVGAVLVIHFIETSLLNPKILGDMMHLHPVLVLAILTVGGHFFGVWGLLLGVPVFVYIVRFVILDEGIPGIIEPVRRSADRPPSSGSTSRGPPGGVVESHQPAAGCQLSPAPGCETVPDAGRPGGVEVVAR